VEADSTSRGIEQATVIVAALVGSENVSRRPAFGITNNTSPVLALCRELVGRGVDPQTPLHVYRGETLALIVVSIGKAAALEIDAYGTGFRPRREADAAPPMRRPGRVGIRHRAGSAP
jgi:hypothetical protein